MPHFLARRLACSEDTGIALAFSSMRLPFNMIQPRLSMAPSDPISSDAQQFHEALRQTRIRDLGLTISGTRLEPIVNEFIGELERAGVRRVQPRFYLSTEWGVPFGTVAIAIPFYIARPDLIHFHLDRAGHIEGVTPSEILKYLRHEMGHVVNYAYRLYDREDWIAQFGSITQPYEEEYRPQPFSRDFVRHLPGWYAQKHPDEDWAETFAVCMTPNLDWRVEYADWPVALAKLQYCERITRELADTDPVENATDLDEDVTELEWSLEQFYQRTDGTGEEKMPLLDGSLRAVFDDLGSTDPAVDGPALPAGPLIRRLEQELSASVFRWTGHFPERTRRLVRFLAERADAMNQVYVAARERNAIVGVTALVTTLAMNHVYRGSYVPASQSPNSA
jgi:hypothetical protein